MSNTIALIPARAGSKGIPGKNFRRLGHKTLVAHAYDCAMEAGVDRAIISSDRVLEYAYNSSVADLSPPDIQPFIRPAHLAQDDTPMFGVVQHAAETLQLADDDIIVLLQPTQPLRTPERVKEAIALLHDSGADSVVSVVELPLTHSPDMQCVIFDGALLPYDGPSAGGMWWQRPKRRQDARQTYIPDGTVYALRRRTLSEYGNLFGMDVRPLIISPDETCELDTEADWAALEARWREKHEAKHV